MAKGTVFKTPAFFELIRAARCHREPVSLAYFSPRKEGSFMIQFRKAILALPLVLTAAASAQTTMTATQADRLFALLENPSSRAQAVARLNSLKEPDLAPLL